MTKLLLFKDWLTRSIIMNKLFCWPCLLFLKDSEDIWYKKGCSDLKNLPSGLNLHEKNTVHSICMLCMCNYTKKYCVWLKPHESPKINVFIGTVIVSLI